MNRNGRRLSAVVLLFIFTFLLLETLFYISVDAKRIPQKKKRSHIRSKQRGVNENAKTKPGSTHYNQTQRYPIFDVLTFGAKGDGVSDDSKAFLAAWKKACKVPGAIVEIPSEFKFLISPITLVGPCKPHLVLQVDGILVAPSKLSKWPKSSLFQWLNFKWVRDFTIKGTGTIDGQGSSWWSFSKIQYIQKKLKHVPGMKPTAVRFYGSFNVTVRDIRIANSPQCHLKFDSSDKIKVNNVTISSPESSPNTDGIHLQNTKDVEIQHSNIKCGDDCISIQTGCSNVHIHHINCGPGHGISLGGLGKDNTVACVSNITVERITISNALAGVRIKTWQGGGGSVRSVSFSDIQVIDVKTPIMIDQYYCDKRSCKNQTQAVAITDVKYSRITGTYLSQPVHLACSDVVPCKRVNFTDIHLSPASQSLGFHRPLCWKSYGEAQGLLVPSSIDCLQRGLVRNVERSHEHNC